jgi:hypothetical protein
LAEAYRANNERQRRPSLFPFQSQIGATKDLRRLIREMSIANPLWGAPRMHGELLKLGIDVGQTTVAKYMAKGRRPPSQGWNTPTARLWPASQTANLFAKIYETPKQHCFLILEDPGDEAVIGPIIGLCTCCITFAT